MNRRKFLAGSLGLLTLALANNAFAKIKEGLPHTKTMPVLFVGHGSPMNAITDNPYSRGWKGLRKDIPQPAAILCISAHWLTDGSYVSTSAAPATVHDFGGFPRALHEAEYAAPGSIIGAEATMDILHGRVGGDPNKGLDHGTWSVLLPMYPEANIPVFQLSIDYYQPMEYHYTLAKQLSELRNRGVLIIGSGNIVHNLRATGNINGGYDWAYEFDEHVKKAILSGDHQSIINYEQFGRAASLSVPTPDHYIPLLYALGLQRSTDSLRFINESITRGALGMRSVIIEEA